MSTVNARAVASPHGAGPMRPTLSIRARLMALAAIVLVPLMADRIRAIETDRTERTNTANQQVLTLVRQAVEAHREIIISARAFLHSAARTYATTATTRESCDRFLADLAGQVPWIKILSVADPQGRVLCSSRPEAVGLDISGRLYVQEAMRTGQYVLSDYAAGRLNTTPMTVAVYPQRARNGGIEALLVGVLDSAWINRLAKMAGERPGSAVLMIDGDGTVLTHYPAPNDWTGREFKDHPLIHAMLAQPEGVAVENGLDGVSRVFGFVQLPGTASRLAIGLDANAVTGRVEREMRYAYLQLVAIGLILTVALWVGGDRFIVRPIRLIAMMAERFGRGEYEIHATKQRWAAEFIPLVKALDEMAAKILARRDQARVVTEHLSELATTDELSGLPNRRAFDAALEAAWERARMRGEAVALAMIDADYFKAFNDHYGHVRGDDCLRVLSKVLSSAVQTDFDLVARYGGEEFALLLPGMDLVSALKVAERLRKAVEDRHLRHAARPNGRVTVSIGVASLRPAPRQDAQALVEAADSALYTAKDRGRNTVAAHQPMDLRAAS